MKAVGGFVIFSAAICIALLAWITMPGPDDNSCIREMATYMKWAHEVRIEYKDTALDPVGRQKFSMWADRYQKYYLRLSEEGKVKAAEMGFPERLTYDDAMDKPK